jgi:hypothetical protein
MARTRSDIKDALAELLYKIIKEGVTVTNDEGTPVQLTPPAQYLQAAIAFLKVDEDQAERPTPKNTSGLLKEFERKLPFGAQPTKQ